MTGTAKNLRDLSTDTLIAQLGNNRFSRRGWLSPRTRSTLEIRDNHITIILERRGLSAASIKAIR